MRQVDERHVQAMETVVGLWCYPTMADRALLVEVLELVREASRVRMADGGVRNGDGWRSEPRVFDDWRVQYAPLGEPYESDQ